MFGKNHLFTYEKLETVWDELREVCLGNYDEHPSFKKSFSSFELEPDHEYNQTARLTNETIQFARSAETPFIAWVNYQDPHPAFTCPEPYKSLFDPNKVEIPASFYNYDTAKQPRRNELWRRHSEMDTCHEDDIKKAIATYMGQVRYIDDSVGKILDSLEESGLDKNTIVLFFSDHGELLGDHRMTHKLPVFYDSLTKIPAIIRHPKGIGAGERFLGLVEEIDLAPTLLEFLGVEIPPTMVGVSWADAIRHSDYSGKESVISEAGGGAPTPATATPGLSLKAPHAPTSFGPGSMIRIGDWKLSVYHDDRCELYNIAEDPEELVNRYDDPGCAETRIRMTTELLKRSLGVKVRDVGLDWPSDTYPVDVRFESLHKRNVDRNHITGLD